MDKNTDTIVEAASKMPLTKKVMIGVAVSLIAAGTAAVIVKVRKDSAVDDLVESVSS